MDDFGKASKLMFYLDRSGYEFADELDAIRVIRENHIDISEFELPYDARNLQEYEQKLLEREEKIREIEKKEFCIDLGMRMY